MPVSDQWRSRDKSTAVGAGGRVEINSTPSDAKSPPTAAAAAAQTTDVKNVFFYFFTFLTFFILFLFFA